MFNDTTFEDLKKDYTDLSIEKPSIISSTEREKMLLKTARSLPDNPSDSGMKASAVKPKFYSFATDTADSLYAYFNRAIWVINTAFDNVIEKLNTQFGDNKDQIDDILDAISSFKTSYLSYVEQMKTTITDINETITNINSDITDINVDLETKQTTIEANATNITTINGNIDTIETSISDLEESISTANGRIDSTIESINTTNTNLATTNSNLENTNINLSNEITNRENAINGLIGNASEGYKTLGQLQSKLLEAIDTLTTTISNHKNATGNVHTVYGSQVAMSDSNSKTITSALNDLANQIELLGGFDDQTSADFSSLTDRLSAVENHTSSTSNPHNVTKSQVGLGSVDNTSDINKPISNATQQALDLKANKEDTQNAINKSLYNLGAFDTISGNVITRQTGYVDLGKLDYESNSGSFPSNSVYFTISSAKPNGRLSLSSSSLFDNVYFYTSSNLILLLNNTYNNANDLKSALSGIMLQYELATPYTEEIIEGQPLITLDSQGSQWLRDEWGKGINLFNNDGNISLNGIGLVVGNTYTLSNNESQFLIKISISEGSATSLVEAKNTNKVTFVWDGQVNNVYFFNNDYTTKKLTDYQIMLNEGDHPYPYQPYNSKAHITNYEADFLKEESLKSANLLDKDNVVVGYINSTNGVLTNNANFMASDYIEIKPNTTYSNNIKIKSFSETGLAFYDSNKNYISGIINNSSAYNKFTTPSNAKYLRLSIDTNYSQPYDDINNLMLNEGSEHLPYQPYKGSLVHSSDLEAVKSELNQVVSTNTNNISSLQTSVSVNAFSILIHTNNISSLQTSLQTNTNNISSLQTSVSTINGKLLTYIDCTLDDNDDISCTFDTSVITKENAQNYAVKMKVYNSDSDQHNYQYLYFDKLECYEPEGGGTIEHNIYYRNPNHAFLIERRINGSNATDVVAYENGYNVKKSIEAIYASSDHTKGTIEKRLTALGFKEGVMSLSGYTLTDSTAPNTVKKQGKYCIANLDVSMDSSKPYSITVPNDFKPKQATTFYAKASAYLYSQLTDYVIEVTIDTSGVINLTTFPNNYWSRIRIKNAGWELA